MVDMVREISSKILAVEEDLEGLDEHYPDHFACGDYSEAPDQFRK